MDCPGCDIRKRQAAFSLLFVLVWAESTENRLILNDYVSNTTGLQFISGRRGSLKQILVTCLGNLN
jgi:hypothetical protein